MICYMKTGLRQAYGAIGGLLVGLGAGLAAEGGESGATLALSIGGALLGLALVRE